MEEVKVRKRPGRPSVYKSEMKRGSFRLPADAVVSLRKIGGGNITRGILRLVKRWEEGH